MGPSKVREYKSRNLGRTFDIDRIRKEFFGGKVEKKSPGLFLLELGRREAGAGFSEADQANWKEMVFLFWQLRSRTSGPSYSAAVEVLVDF